MIEATLKTWVLCWIPSTHYDNREIHYWGDKYFHQWNTDIDQATHFATIKAAKTKMRVIRKDMTKRGWWTDEDKMFIGEIDTVIPIKETGIEG